MRFYRFRYEAVTHHDPKADRHYRSSFCGCCFHLTPCAFLDIRPLVPFPPKWEGTSLWSTPLHSLVRCQLAYSVGSLPHLRYSWAKEAYRQGNSLYQNQILHTDINVGQSAKTGNTDLADVASSNRDKRNWQKKRLYHFRSETLAYYFSSVIFGMKHVPFTKK